MLQKTALACAAIALLTAAGCKRTPPPPPQIDAAPPTSRHVVVISIDGLLPDHLKKPNLAIPALRALMSAGVVAEGVVSVWPSVTYPAHVTMVTGVSPARHGVLTNKVFDPLMQTDDAWVWNASAIRVRTLWDAARTAKVSTGASYWPVTVGAAIDHNVPQIWTHKTDADDAAMRKLATPGLAEELERDGPLPAEHRTDVERARAAAHIVAMRHPGLMFVYLTDLDTVQHKTGPMSREADETLERIDDLVGAVVDASKRAGIADRTTFVVLSDHGFTRVDVGVRPGVALARGGFIDVGRDGRPTAYRATAVTAGGLAGIVLRDPNDTTVARDVTALFTRLAADPANGVARLYSKEEMAARGGFPDAALVLEARPRHTFLRGVTGELVGPTDYRGNHGDPPDRVEMHATLVLSGRGVKVGGAMGVVKLVDVAPTVAQLLGLQLDGVEGRVLVEALSP